MLDPTTGPNAAQPLMPSNALAGTPDTSQMPGIGTGLGANAMAAAPTSAAPNAPLAQGIMSSTQVANKINPNNNQPGAWAQNLVAGVQNALAGFAVPGGTGPLQGIGQAAQQGQARRQQQFENQQKVQQAALEKTKADREQTNQDRDYHMRVEQQAMAQAKNISDINEHDQRMKAFTQEASIKQFELQKAETDFRESQIDKEDALKAVGGAPLVVGGKPVGAFYDEPGKPGTGLAAATKFASANDLASAHNNDYRTRILLGADGGYHIMEVPDSGPKWITVKGADGKPTKINATPQDALAFADKMSDLRHKNAESNELDQRAALEKVQAGTATDTQKAIVASGAYTAMQNDKDFKSLPKNDDGSINELDPKYKAMDEKYGVSKAYEASNPGYNTATGEAYIRNLSPNMQGTVRALGEGREDSSLLPRGKEKTPIVNALNRAYPGYEEGEQKNYFKQMINFTSGVQGQAINSGQAVSNHLYELHQLATPSSRIPGTDAWVAYNNKANTVADELAAFYGTTTIPGIEAIHKSMTTLASRDTAIQTQAQSMQTKMNEYKKQWDDSIPKYLVAAHDGKKPQIPGWDQNAANRVESLKNGAAPSPATPTATPGVSHDVIVNGVKLGTTTDGGKTMIPVTK